MSININAINGLRKGTRILLPTFINAEVGDKVQSLQFGAGKIIEIEEGSDLPIVVQFEYCDVYQSYSLAGVAARNKNTTLFWPFNGQFPTEEALNKPVDPYAVHGVTKEQMNQIADCIKKLHGFSTSRFEWNEQGFCYAYESLTQGGIGRQICVNVLNKNNSSYKHFKTIIILERDV